MKVEPQFVDLIDVGDRLRAVDPKKVSQLAESMKAIGLLNPIYVSYSADGSACTLVAGAHRLAAAKKLGWDSIDTVELPGGDLEAQLAEIDENLCRSELTPTEEAEHIGRRKEVWEAMQAAKEIQVGQVDPPEIGFKMPPPQEQGFATATEKATGKAKRSTNRAARRYTEVCQAARDLIKRTKLDTGSYLDNLAKRGMTDEEQVAHVEQALAELADDDRRKELAEEAKARAAAAKQEREDAKNECLSFLFDELHAQKWGYLIDLIERNGGTLKAADMRKWEAPLAKAA